MTIGGALSELDNLLKADDIPCYYKPSIKAVIDTIALEQESTIKNDKDDLGVDCISRKAVLDAIDSKAWEFCDYLISKGRNDEQKPVSHFADNLRECVREEIPSVTPQEPRWIPVNERLPVNKETVLVTFKHFVSGNTIGLGSVILLRGKPHWHVREQNPGTYDVLAWMPLPKPYKAESEG